MQYVRWKAYKLKDAPMQSTRDSATFYLIVKNQSKYERTRNNGLEELDLQIID